MMTLHAYLAENAIRQEDFAARVGVKQATISRLVRRDVLPGLVLAVRIERETDGAVPVEIWVGGDEVAA